MNCGRYLHLVNYKISFLLITKYQWHSHIDPSKLWQYCTYTDNFQHYVPGTENVTNIQFQGIISQSAHLQSSKPLG